MTRSGMRPFGSIISLDDARARIAGAIKPIARMEIVPLHEAVGRVMAGQVNSAVDVPPFARASMDGYAVRAADTAGATRDTPRTLRRMERIFTGQVPTQPVGAGECAEIATGAPMPPDADAVVMVEDTTADDEVIAVSVSVSPGQNVGRQAADIAAGQQVLADGELLNPARIGALAAIGWTEVQVYATPRVAILSTGNEIAEAGAPLEPGQIYDINRFTLGAIITEHGGLAEPHRAAADTKADLNRALDACRDADLIVFSGGSSVGERDLVQDVLESRGITIFHGIAVKPGKPTAFGLVNGIPFFGMPGYPTSCLSNAYILLVPALRTLARLPPYAPQTVRARLAHRITSASGRHQFYTVKLIDGTAVPAFKASGDITSMSRADGYIEVGADIDAVAEGTEVDVHLF